MIAVLRAFCPFTGEVVSGGNVDGGFIADGWGNTFRSTCDEGIDSLLGEVHV